MSNKKEIEVKIQIDDQQFFQTLMSKIKNNHKEVEKEYQHDIYYSPKNNNYMDEKYPYKWLRLRYINENNAEICFKHFFPEGEEKHIYCNEYQSKITDPKGVINIFSELELQIVANVEKTRTTYLYNRYLISFDTVKDLGNFIEIEVNSQLYDETKEKELLNKEIEKLGLSKFPTNLRGYPYLIYSKSKNENN